MKLDAWIWFCCKLRQEWQKASLLVFDLTDVYNDSNLLQHQSI